MNNYVKLLACAVAQVDGLVDGIVGMTKRGDFARDHIVLVSCTSLEVVVLVGRRK
jgi:ATP sulfurylase